MDNKELHGKAARIVREVIARYPHGLPEDVRSVVGYYQSCVRGCDRAAQQLVDYFAATKGDPR